MQAVEAGDMAKALQELELLLGDDMPVSPLRALPQARLILVTDCSNTKPAIRPLG